MPGGPKKGDPETNQQEFESRLVAAADDVVRKTDGAICPHCHTTKWLVETMPSALNDGQIPRLGYVPFSTAVFFGGAPAIPSIVMSCMNCGFIRHHNLIVILRNLGMGGSYGE